MLSGREKKKQLVLYVNIEIFTEWLNCSTGLDDKISLIFCRVTSNVFWVKHRDIFVTMNEKLKKKLITQGGRKKFQKNLAQKNFLYHKFLFSFPG
jgi:DNA topoisomerase VI subunit A